ncbi:MAG TPA: tail fiber protein [Acetobacteraceae bacterium]
MSDPFTGQIIAVAFKFAPAGWAFCDGSTMQISQYNALFNLIGTTYGGDGQATFNLPDLRGRGAVSAGQGPGLSNYLLGQRAGTEQVTLTSGQIGAHAHDLTGAANATSSAPVANSVLGTAATDIYAASGGTTALAPASVGPSPGGGSTPHENRQPYQTINYIIALNGIYPPRQ